MRGPVCLLSNLIVKLTLKQQLTSEALSESECVHGRGEVRVQWGQMSRRKHGVSWARQALTARVPWPQSRWGQPEHVGRVCRWRIAPEGVVLHLWRFACYFLSPYFCWCSYINFCPWSETFVAVRIPRLESTVVGSATTKSS